MGVSIEEVILKSRLKSNIKEICNIKKYITVYEKKQFIEDFFKYLDMALSDERYNGFGIVVSLAIFNVVVVKYYTNIDVKCTVDEYDMLRSADIMNKIIDSIGDDYKDILELARSLLPE